MKTKNIFRMLLVAAALLLGANNVKAADSDLLVKTITMTSWTEENLPLGIFDNANINDTIRIFGSRIDNTAQHSEVYIQTNTNNSIFSINDWNYTDIFAKGYIDFPINQNAYNSLQRLYNWDKSEEYNHKICGSNIKITKISLIKDKTTKSPWKAPDTAPDGGTKIINSSILDAVTVGTTQVGSDSHTFNDTEFPNYLNLRSNNDLTAYNNDSKYGTPITLTVKTNATISFFYRRQCDDGKDENANSFTNDNSKDLKVCAGTDLSSKKTGNITRIEATSDGKNGYITKTYTLGAGTYTVYATGTTIRLHGIAFENYIVPKYNVDSSTTGYGQIEFLTNNYQIEAGTTVQFKLTPSAGYQLSSFTIKDSNQDNVNYTQSGGVYSFTMPALNVTVSATFTEITPETREVMVGGNGYKYSTWAPDIAIDYSITPTGVKAYRAKGTTTKNNQLYVELEQITSKVLANTPVILIAENSGTFSFTEAVTGATNIGTNLLSQGTGSVGPNANYYILTVKNGRVVFAQANTQATVPSDKAYLDLSGVSGARARTIRLSFSNNDDGTTAINSIENEQTSNNDIYNMTGQRVANPTKGFYIINSKKVIIK